MPAGLVVEAQLEGHVVRTDQPVKAGGAGSAPSPFDLFLASLATCAGYYALAFCRERGIPTEGLGVTLETARDPQSRELTSIAIQVTLPPDFPERYRTAILRAVDQCAVKKAMLSPPEMPVSLAGEALVRSGS